MSNTFPVISNQTLNNINHKYTYVCINAENKIKYQTSIRMAYTLTKKHEGNNRHELTVRKARVGIKFNFYTSAVFIPIFLDKKK